MTRSVRRLVIALSLLSAPAPARAFEACGVGPSDVPDIHRQIAEYVSGTTPAKHFDHIKDIEFKVPERDKKLFPRATFDPATGRQAIVFSLEFYRIFCRIALATALQIMGKGVDAIAHTTDETSRCLARNTPVRDCLSQHAAALETRLGAEFAALADRERETYEGLFGSAIRQLAMHEYAHLFLDHHRRISAGELPRIQAEFDADFFALSQSLTGADPVFAMTLFFAPMSEFDQLVKGSRSDDYESTFCRYANVEVIRSLYGVIPILIRAAVNRDERISHDEHVAKLKEWMDEPVPQMDSAVCGKLSNVYLREAHAEFKALLERVYADFDLLQTQDPSLLPLAIRYTPKAMALVRDLYRMAAEFRWLGSLSGGLAVEVLRRISLAGEERQVPQVELLISEEPLTRNLLSSDYGVLLGEWGSAILRGETDADDETRVREGKRLLLEAVRYLPNDLTESWLNLGYIALVEGDCVAAEKYMIRAAQTNRDEQQRRSAEEIIAVVRSANESGDCARIKADSISVFYPR